MAAISSHGFRYFNSHAWLQTLHRNPFPHSFPSFTYLSVSLSSPSPVGEQDSEESQLDTTANLIIPTATRRRKRNPSFFPKRGQRLELVRESLAFKGKGLCKVSDTGFALVRIGNVKNIKDAQEIS